MRFLFIAAMFWIATVSTLLARGGEPLTREVLKSLPEFSQNIVPVLEIEWSTLPIDQFALLVQFQTGRWHTSLFNPFGNHSLGCPYQVYVTDADWNPVYEVINIYPANIAVPPPNAWINADNKRVIGRRYWRNRDWTLASARGEAPPSAVHLVEGNYLLHLLVTARLETYPPFEQSPAGNAAAQALWRGEELNQCVCRAKPVPIQVGADGRVQRPASVPPHPEHKSPIRITTTIEKQEMTVQAMLITEREYQCTNPGLRGISIDAGIHVKPPVQDVRYFMNHSLWGKDDPPGFEGYRHVPKDAILGVRRRYLGPIDPGAYEISVAFPSNLWLDRDVDPAALRSAFQITVSEEQIRN